MNSVEVLSFTEVLLDDWRENFGCRSKLSRDAGSKMLLSRDCFKRTTNCRHIEVDAPSSHLPSKKQDTIPTLPFLQIWKPFRDIQSHLNLERDVQNDVVLLLVHHPVKSEFD